MGDLLGSPRVAPPKPFCGFCASYEEICGVCGENRQSFFILEPYGAICIWIYVAKHNGCDHTSTNAPDPIRTPKLKRAWARVVLRWVTSWEVLVLHPQTFLRFLRVIRRNLRSLRRKSPNVLHFGAIRSNMYMDLCRKA
ncbi:hypothetical protein M5689_011038 [Euphorbia peplus]|nr:hypothetical protein M5689_011038 [Euphorbia peplus]